MNVEKPLCVFLLAPVLGACSGSPSCDSGETQKLVQEEVLAQRGEAITDKAREMQRREHYQQQSKLIFDACGREPLFRTKSYSDCASLTIKNRIDNLIRENKGDFANRYFSRAQEIKNGWQSSASIDSQVDADVSVIKIVLSKIRDQGEENNQRRCAADVSFQFPIASLTSDFVVQYSVEKTTDGGLYVSLVEDR